MKILIAYILTILIAVIAIAVYFVRKDLMKKGKKFSSVRVRFAPSPTGMLHIGGLRTLLFNYLFALKENGKLILRIEDTDKARYVPESIDYIKRCCSWLGIEFDESPFKKGKYGPYIQSERKDIYPRYVKYLLDKGYAYRAFETKEELEALKKKYSNFSYDSNTRYLPDVKNELNLPKNKIDEFLKEGRSYVVRIKMPKKDEIKCFDYLRGETPIIVNTDNLDDKVLWKSSTGLPTYHLASVVDDHLMKITHVIRGDEWLASYPVHFYLYKCFQWEIPIFVHVPVMLNPTGNGKISKRNMDKYNFPIHLLSYKDIDEDGKEKEIKGYDSFEFNRQGFINSLVLNGWNPGNDKEIMTFRELVENFSLNRIKKSPSKFNWTKAIHINKKHKTKSNG